MRLYLMSTATMGADVPVPSYLIRTDDGQRWSIVPDVPVNEFSRAKIDVSVAELKEEKSLVAELIGG